MNEIKALFDRQLVVSLIVMSAIALLLLPVGGYRIDFDVYRTGAQVFLSGQSIYGELPVLAQGGHLPFTYPPISAVLFSAFTVVSLWLGSALWTVLSLLCLLLVIRLVIARLGWQLPTWALIGLPVATLALGPVRETLDYGQINIVLMALVMIGCLCFGNRPLIAGSMVGLAIAIKLTPAVFLAYFLLRRDWRGLLATVGGTLAFTGIGFLLAPRDSIAYWTQVLFDTGRIGGLVYTSNQSINAVVRRAGLDGTAASITWFVIAVAAGLALMWLASRALQVGDELTALTVVGYIALLCSPVSWGHHWVWCVPLLLLCAQRALVSGRRGFWVLTGVGVAVFVLMMHWWLPNTDNQELHWNLWQSLVGNSLLIWSVVALVSLYPNRSKSPAQAVPVPESH